MENFVVFVIVLMAVGLTVGWFYRRLTARGGRKGCAADCSIANNCSLIANTKDSSPAGKENADRAAAVGKTG